MLAQCEWPAIDKSSRANALAVGGGELSPQLFRPGVVLPPPRALGAGERLGPVLLGRGRLPGRPQDVAQVVPDDGVAAATGKRQRPLEFGPRVGAPALAEQDPAQAV